MNQTKEKAPCTVAAVQNANIEPTQAQDENTIKLFSSQVLHISDGLDFAEIEIGEIDIVLQDLVQQLYEEIELVHGPHNDYSKTRLAYYAAMLRMISHSVVDLRKEFSKTVKAANGLCDLINK